MLGLIKSEHKPRDLSLIIAKILSFKKNFTISIGKDSNFEIYNEDNSKNNKLEEQINRILKDINVKDIDIIFLLSKFSTKSENEILSQKFSKFSNFKNEVELYYIGEYENNGKIYFSNKSKKIVFDLGNKFKEESKTLEKKNIEDKNTENVEVDELKDTSIILSDELKFKYIDNAKIELNEKKERKIITLLDNFVSFCLHNDIGDIIVTEEELPYFVKGESLINSEELDKKIIKLMGEKVLTQNELIFFIQELEKLSKSDNILTSLQENFKEEGKGYVDFAVNIKGVKLRVNTAFRAGKKYSVVMRVIKSGKPPKLEDLGLVDKHGDGYRDVLTQPFGLILLVGPTGSGKSYSLTSMLGEINRTQRKRIITLEDPIEFEHENVLSKFEQREVGVDVRSYKDGLTSALRQKPHIIVCGEIRTAEVMKLAMEAAATGHIVFATFHSNDVIQTIQRILEFFPVSQQKTISQQLSEILLGVFVQKLVPRKGGGKVLIKEVMINKTNVKTSIAQNDMKSLLLSIESGGQYGMMTNDTSIERLFNDGLLEDKIAYDYAKDKDLIARITNYDMYKRKK